jgi:hypothetical protein
VWIIGTSGKRKDIRKGWSVNMVMYLCTKIDFCLQWFAALIENVFDFLYEIDSKVLYYF